MVSFVLDVVIKGDSYGEISSTMFYLSENFLLTLDILGGGGVAVSFLFHFSLASEIFPTPYCPTKVFFYFSCFLFYSTTIDSVLPKWTYFHDASVNPTSAFQTQIRSRETLQRCLSMILMIANKEFRFSPPSVLFPIEKWLLLVLLGIYNQGKPSLLPPKCTIILSPVIYVSLSSNFI